MKAAVRYHSRGGNTKKLALAIAEAVGVEALGMDKPLTEDVDILFIGSAVYAHGVDEAVKTFIRGIDVKVGKAVNFSTAAIVKSTYKQVGKLLSEKGIPQAAEEFYCRGSFGMMHKGRPNEADLKAAAEFAKKIVG
ncbi:MAG: flavodoxin [Clostridia bacterium]|nr:flavodoxin [Clostridia bacterium]MBQ1434858.1 flavodoxin [Clostridia bacterium]MBQ4249860.1 flavodoxin [Clostridia bacterium]